MAIPQAVPHHGHPAVPALSLQHQGHRNNLVPTAPDSPSCPMVRAQGGIAQGSPESSIPTYDPAKVPSADTGCHRVTFAPARSSLILVAHSSAGDKHKVQDTTKNNHWHLAKLGCTGAVVTLWRPPHTAAGHATGMGLPLALVVCEDGGQRWAPQQGRHRAVPRQAGRRQEVVRSWRWHSWTLATRKKLGAEKAQLVPKVGLRGKKRGTPWLAPHSPGEGAVPVKTGDPPGMKEGRSEGS